MKLLIDTHVVLWWLDDPGRIATPARQAISDRGNEVFVSVASAWEIAIKRALGKLEAPSDFEAVIRASRFTPLPIELKHAVAVESLSNHHRDPFDRMLVAQAITENLTIVTRDTNIQRYQVSWIEA